MIIQSHVSRESLKIQIHVEIVTWLANGSPFAKAFIDVRVFNPQAKANWVKSIPQMYKSHEEEKKQGYLPRVLQVEKGTFTPAVFSTSGGMGKEADRLLRRMAERMSIKRGENYSSVVSFLRRRFRFDLLKTCVIAMRGYKVTRSQLPQQRR